MLTEYEKNVLSAAIFDITRAVEDLNANEKYIQEGFGKHAVQRTQLRLQNVISRINRVLAKP
jgi:hypothetical protein